MRRAVNDALMSAGAILILLVLLSAFDGRVREQVTMRMGRTQSSAAVVDVGSRVRDLAVSVVDVVREETEMHATLMVFVLAATVLTVLMLRV
jgi:hypothetical protein